MELTFEEQYKLQKSFFYPMIKELQCRHNISFEKAVDLFDYLNDEIDNRIKEESMAKYDFSRQLF